MLSLWALPKLVGFVGTTKGRALCLSPDLTLGNSVSLFHEQSKASSPNLDAASLSSAEMDFSAEGSSTMAPLGALPADVSLASPNRTMRAAVHLLGSSSWAITMYRRAGAISDVKWPRYYFRHAGEKGS